MSGRGDENHHWKRTKVPGDRPRPTPSRVHGCRFSPSPRLTLADARTTSRPVQGRRGLNITDSFALDYALTAFVIGTEVSSQVATACINVALGICVLSLLRSVMARTVRPGTAPAY